MTKPNSKTVTYATLIVLLHGPITVVHGAAHVGETVMPSVLDSIFIFVVIWIAPFAAIILLRMQRWQTGSIVLMVAMVGSLVFGVYNHFLMPGPDNVASAPAGFWQVFFQISALLLAVAESIGTLVGLQLFRLSLARKSLAV